MANPKILEAKQTIIDEIANNVKESSSFIFLENNGLTVAETMELRRKLRESGSDIKVYKNTLMARALNDLKINIDVTNVKFHILQSHKIMVLYFWDYKLYNNILLNYL